MIIDLYTQIWSTPDQLGTELAEGLRARQSEMPPATGAYDGSPAAHEQAMTPVNGALVFGFHSERLGAHVPNEFIAEFVARSPRGSGRLAGVAAIDPMADGAADALEAALSMGFAGVTVSPAAQGFHPAHSRAMAIYERCADAGLPLFVTNGGPPASSAMLEFARPLLWDEVARTVSDLRIVIGQIGHPWIDETLVLLSKHRQVYADISGVARPPGGPWLLYNALQSALGLHVMNKLLFASGFPRETPAKTIEALYSVNSLTSGTQLPSIPRSQVRGIIERDSFALLGIEPAIAGRRSGSGTASSLAALANAEQGASGR
jgi:uncharacterized protein